MDSLARDQCLLLRCGQSGHRAELSPYCRILALRCTSPPAASKPGFGTTVLLVVATPLQLIQRYLNRQWNQTQDMSRTCIKHEQGLGGVEVSDEQLEPAVAVNGISFPVKAALAAHGPIFSHILIVRSGAENDIELGAVFGRNRTGDRRSGKSGAAAGTSSKLDMRCTVDASLNREAGIELNRRWVDFDTSVLEEIRKSLGGEGLQFGRRVLFVPLDATVIAAHRGGERRAAKQKRQKNCSQMRHPRVTSKRVPYKDTARAMLQE
jgi:hypothetical protein